MTDLHSWLTRKSEIGQLPRLTAYNRIDGPGSSLDLREFQAAFWRLPEGPPPDDEDEFAVWSKDLPRTVGITISTGSIVEAHPIQSGRIGVASHDYGYEFDLPAGHVPHNKDFWLLKIIDTFGLHGVRFDLHNLVPGIKSSGLGGSATAATGVCLLANYLAGRPFRGEQIVAMAAMMEQDLGVSITGAQEQSNVVFGGVTDYVWFPWGVPSSGGGYGSSIRRPLLRESDHQDLASRLRVYHSGTERSSTDVNTVWRRRLADSAGFDLHLTKLRLVLDFREGIRKKDWERVKKSIREYAKVRIELCPEYMTSRCWDIQAQCESFGAESFPLGAGGGGAVLIFCPSAERLVELDEVLTPVFRRITFSLKANGHIVENVES